MFDSHVERGRPSCVHAMTSSLTQPYTLTHHTQQKAKSESTLIAQLTSHLDFFLACFLAAPARWRLAPR